MNLGYMGFESQTDTGSSSVTLHWDRTSPEIHQPLVNIETGYCLNIVATGDQLMPDGGLSRTIRIGDNVTTRFPMTLDELHAAGYYTRDDIVNFTME